MQDTINGPDGIAEVVQHLFAAHAELDRRFHQSGGLGALLDLYDRVRRELDHVSHDELERMTSDIKRVVEALLRMDYELRTVQQLKRVLEAGRQAVGPAAG